MRGALATILYEATRHDATYLFEDSIQTIDEDPDGITVTFQHAPSHRFDIVIGADGLHSIVRRLTFASEDRFRRFLGGYLAGVVLPNYLGLQGRMVVWNAPGRLSRNQSSQTPAMPHRATHGARVGSGLWASTTGGQGVGSQRPVPDRVVFCSH